MSVYSYSIVDDFNNGTIKPLQFKREIAESSIGTNMKSILTQDGQANIYFTSTLNGSEETILDGLVAAHVPTPPKITFFSITPTRDSINNQSYFRIADFQYAGSDVNGLINQIDIISYKDNNVTSYDIKIVDVTNATIIKEMTGFSNNSAELIEILPLSNIPTSQALIEIQAKRNGGKGNSKSIYFQSINVYYGN